MRNNQSFGFHQIEKYQIAKRIEALESGEFTSVEEQEKTQESFNQYLLEWKGDKNEFLKDQKYAKDIEELQDE